MQCPACQVECDPEAVFCPQCGQRVKQDQAAPAPEEVAPAEESPATPEPAAAKAEHGGQHDRFLRSAATGHAPAVDDEDEPEDGIWTGSFSKKGMIGQWIVASVVTLLALIVAIFMGFGGNAWMITLGLLAVMWGGLAAWYGYRRLSVHYTLTSQRLIHESGILWRTIDRIELIDIDDVTFKQGPVERVFRVGRIIVISGDKTSPELTLPGIDQVRRVADEIDDARRKERRRRGLHMITQGAS